MLPAPTSPPAILIVEDEPAILAILERLLRDLALGCAILSAADSAAALALVQHQGVALVITDYNLAGMNGLDLVTHLKQQAPAVRVAVITAYDTPSLRARAWACGIDYYIPKPFPLQLIEQVVCDALR